MSRRNKPEVVVVTGASAGVGRATARKFAENGAHIGLVARGNEGLEGARREVEASGGRALVLRTDVANPDEVEAAASKVEETFGPIDIWVNNAMASVFSPFKAMTPEEYRRVTEVTYLGYVYGTMSALRRMQLRDRGAIVQVGSAWRSEEFRCHRHTQAPSTLFRALPNLFGLNCSTRTAAFGFQWYTCRL